MDNIELEDLVYTYPPYNVENIQTLISGKEEFREIAGLPSEPPPKRGELFRHQKSLDWDLRPQRVLHLIH